MLLDYHKGVEDELKRLRDDHISQLINAEPNRHDLHKGHVIAFNAAIDVLADVLKRFSGDEAEGEAIKRLTAAKGGDVRELRSTTYFRGRA
jgi:hypothetical protein